MRWSGVHFFAPYRAVCRSRGSGPLGLYYARAAQWGNFFEDVGDLFEQYVGRQLRI